MSIDPLGVITAVATGTATITGVKDGLSAPAAVTVVGGGTLPAGTVRWAVSPAAGISIRPPIYSHRVSDEVPEIFSVETDSATNRIFTVRGVGPTGEQRWTAVAPGEPLFGDSFGGVVSALKNSGGERVGFARSSGPSGTLPWRYESAGEVTFGAQSPEGIIFATEIIRSLRPNGSTFGDAFVLVLDGETGGVKFRLPIAREILDERECTPSSANYRTPRVTRAVIGRAWQAALVDARRRECGSELWTARPGGGIDQRDHWCSCSIAGGCPGVGASMAAKWRVDDLHAKRRRSVVVDG